MVAGISVVIPNYNGIHLFEHTLPTVVEALQHVNKPNEIIVVDDCSTDTSVAYLQQHYPEIKIIQNKVNSGFSVTANNGIKAATYDKVLLLNSDVKLTPDYFANQYKYFDKPDTFGVMGRIVGWEDEKIQDGAKFPYYHGSKIKTSGNYLLKDERLMQDGLYSMYLSGANAFIDKEKFLLIGGFNELFSPFYVEDYELSLRAWRLGFKCYYDYNSVCRHQVSTSIKSKSKKRYVSTIYDRNKMFLHAIHLEGVQRLLWYLQLIPEALVRIFTFRWHYLKSLSMFMNASEQVNQSRLQFETKSKALGTRCSIGEIKEFILSSIKAEKVIL
ncbi:glycosyltransferase family 2 protein [Pontibacter cellulosilyticus]|uniref:Glycosyltransferase family 2 protein n=1 Tax=Pontibacter cellulosilyticus TaxID=1720253 RepID=A0A923N8M4_9BACT|nr:glycosyltransferase family 2 protein [Pontibacter cellulosilyticus]MBC5992897.1 glycosyltransferase family 2 protein [Pontibacter cellulosilyticus]